MSIDTKPSLHIGARMEEEYARAAFVWQEAAVDRVSSRDPYMYLVQLQLKGDPARIYGTASMSSIMSCPSVKMTLLSVSDEPNVVSTIPEKLFNWENINSSHSMLYQAVTLLNMSLIELTPFTDLRSNYLYYMGQMRHRVAPYVNALNHSHIDDRDISDSLFSFQGVGPRRRRSWAKTHQLDFTAHHILPTHTEFAERVETEYACVRKLQEMSRLCRLQGLILSPVSPNAFCQQLNIALENNLIMGGTGQS